MELQTLIQIESRPAALSVNFTQLSQAVAAELEKRDVVVTADTVKDTKKICTELNKARQLIAEKRKEAIEAASGPIKEFEGQMKELEVMIAQARSKLTDQVDRFEDETRDLCRDLLAEYVADQYAEREITDDFQTVEIDGLVKISFVTAKGNLSKAAITAVDALLDQAEKLQLQTERRLAELEKESYRLKLSAPLTRDHVLHFLFADAAEYQTQLNNLMQRELEREAKAKANADELQRRRDSAAEAAPAPVAQAEVEEKPAQEIAEPSIPQPMPKAGAIGVYQVTAVFTLEAPATVMPKQIEDAYRKAFHKGEIKSIPEMKVTLIESKDAHAA